MLELTVEVALPKQWLPDGAFVYVIAQNKALSRPVKVLFDDGDFVAVLFAGRVPYRGDRFALHASSCA